jgi:hypothetical protein
MIIYTHMKDKGSLRTHYLKLLKEAEEKKRGLRKSRLIAEQFWELPAIQKAQPSCFMHLCQVRWIPGDD